MDNITKWQNTELNLEESFKKGQYEVLLKYAKDNEYALMSAFFDADTSDFNPTLICGSSKMQYFEKIIKENPIFYALFKLGELNGHLEVLNCIKYYEQANALVKSKFSEFKRIYPTDAALAEAIIKKIYESGSMTLGDLNKTLNTKKELIKATLYRLIIEGFLHYYNQSIEEYALSDNGILIAKQLIK